MAKWNKYQDFEWRTTRIVSGSKSLTPKGSVSLQVRFNDGAIKHMITDAAQSVEDFEFLALWIRLGSPTGSEYKKKSRFSRVLNWWRKIGDEPIKKLTSKKIEYQNEMDRLVSEIGDGAKKLLSYQNMNLICSVLDLRITIIKSIFLL